MILLSEIKEATKSALVEASTQYSSEHKKMIEEALELTINDNAKWMLEMMLENSDIAKKNQSPLCDDTGIPYVMLEVGEDVVIEANIAKIILAVKQGIADGLNKLPGRPMAVKGDDFERIEQSKGLYENSDALLPSPIRIKGIKGDKLNITVMMMGGGPEIRSKTFRVFHRHSLDVLTSTISEWAIEGSKKLGCTPCVPAIGIGRTHYEATCLMLDAMAYGEFGKENYFEKKITEAINQANIGPLGVGGDITALQTFSRIGQHRASGVRIVCLRLGCAVEPRRATRVIG